ncbi:ABC transporter substrate-binding protein [Desulfococcaceae bacterium HSG8]|nr:ABC transporter substrate-binding protein [Desulfococcaceae bacterium HSG8]
MMRNIHILLLFFLILNPGGLSRAGVTGEFFLNENQILTDQGGRTLEIRKPFTRIISLYGAHTENLFSLGLDREIIGVTRQDRFLKKAVNKPVFSYHDDPEKFLAAKPDLVLIRPMIDRGYAKLMQRLEKSGIIVVSVQPKTIEHMYRYWAVTGALTGKKQASECMIGQFRQAVREFGLISGSVRTKKRVYFEAMHKNMKTFTSGSMADFVLRTAGGINVADDGTPSRGTNIAIYGKEKILSKANEIDVFLAQSGAMNQPTKQMIQNEPGFSVIRAVKNNEIYIVDEQIVSRPTMRLLYGIHQIGTILYPDVLGEKWDQIFKKAFRPWTKQSDM